MVRKFRIEAKKDNENWKEIYSGDWLGEFSLSLKEPISAKEVRIVVEDTRENGFGISSIDIYPPLK